MPFFRSLLIIFALFPLTSQALQVSPLETDWSVRDLKTPSRIYVYNNQKEAAAIDIQFFERLIDESGAETLRPTQDFKWHPKALKLKPGQGEWVTVHWNADSIPSIEKAYRYVMEQLPIRFQRGEKEGASQLVVLHKMIGSLYVTPVGGKARLQVQARLQKNKLIVQLENAGSKREIFVSPSLKLKIKSKEKEQAITLDSEELMALRGLNLLAGIRRQIVLPWSGSEGEVIDVEILP